MSSNGSNKENDEDKNKANNNDDNILSSESPTLATRYAHRAATLVRSIEKNSYLIIGIVIGLFILSTLDLLEVHEHLPFSFDPIITVFSVASIVALLFLLRLTIKSKRVLERWADTFERNSISAGINISMGSRTREEAVRAIAETVQEIGPQLREYISSRDNYNEFFDVAFGKEEKTAITTQFDIVIDKDNIKPTENNSYQDLKTALQNYGSAIVKFVNGAIDANTILSYYSLLSRYISITKNSVSLALIIGDDATSDAHNLALHPKDKKIGYMIIIERPLLTP
ncbi:MAG TPA: hypothetical protein VI278_11185 [Nitrososphaeraceae archaeon]